MALLARDGAEARAAQLVDPPGGPATGGGVSLAHDLTLHLIGRLHGEAARQAGPGFLASDLARAVSRAYAAAL